ncbi:methylmalonyl Co-A mutase-associated GTPase MeaB [bacterium]|nr:methylmalonyl Co-A mutase-associated GTPase MeaB [bacterium]
MDRATLGKRLSLLEERGEGWEEVYRNLAQRDWRLPIIVLAGPPGAGKSTLLAHVALHHPQWAYLLVDPTDPLTGGAVLADRARIPFMEDAPFVRSVATRGSAGGAATALWPMLRLFNEENYPGVVVESVGVGQVADSLRALADLLIVVLSPETGDAHQAVKGGLLGEADIVVVNKGDLPGAEALVGHLNALSQKDPLLVSAMVGSGLVPLLDRLNHLPPIDIPRRLRGEAKDFALAGFSSELEQRLDAWNLEGTPLDLP